MKRRFWWWIFGLAFPLVLLTAGGIVFFFMVANQEARVAELPLEEIDMNRVADGTFIGNASTGIVTVRVEVTVENHEITGIDLIRHINGQGETAEDILVEMMAQNTWDVDSVVGATISSMTIKSAVCEALLTGIE